MKKLNEKQLSKKKIYLIFIKFIFLAFIIYWISQRIDPSKMGQIFKQISISYYFLGIFFGVLSIYTIPLSLRVFLNQLAKIKIKVKEVTEIFWSGFAIGFFTPGGVGIDAYKTIRICKNYGKWFENVLAIALDKIYTLAIVLVLTVISSLFVDLSDEKLQLTIYRFAIFFALFMMMIPVGYLIIGKKRLGGLFEFIFTKIQAILERYGRKSNERKLEDFVHLFKLSISFKFLFSFFYTTLLKIVFPILKNYVFLKAFGFDLSFIEHSFIYFCFYIVSMLPISFGHFGVRESSHIILFGLFGVNSEVALMVSFLNLSSQLFNIGFGYIFYVIPKKSLLDEGLAGEDSK